MVKKIIVIAPHPDDETLGCGGTLLKYKSNNFEINWLIVTDIKKEDGWSEKIIKQREKEINRIKKFYGFKNVFRLNFSTALLDQVSRKLIIGKISQIFKKIKPNIVYMPYRGDIHSDHKIVFDCSLSASKNFRQTTIEEINCYETLSETEFASPNIKEKFDPNFFIDITNFFKKKITAFSFYKSEQMKKNLPRNKTAIKALARYRGSRIGVSYAEAFSQILRIN
jgi:LmbE family N-acetylglucosaminyl deacetylase